MAAKPSQVPINIILLVIHDFSARSSDEITLSRGDRVELIERDDDFGDGWYLGKHLTTGKTGLFPEVYTTPAPKPTINTQPSPNTTSTATTNHHSPARAVSTPHAAPTPISDARARSASQISLDTAVQSNSSRGVASPRSAGFDNPVLNETLSVIDEHIIDMRTPQSNRNSRREPSQNRGSANPYEAEYRLSYINGAETDEEESRLLTHAEVSRWSPMRVAEYLEDVGVDREHCHVFRDQEISGEVILTMEQSAIFIKEFELGSVGRRLKTWHKIKALQDEVQASTRPSAARSNSDYSAHATDSVPELANPKMRRSSAVQANNPRYLSPTDYTGEMRNRQGLPERGNGTASPLSAGALSRSPEEHSPRLDYAPREPQARPSAASIRQLGSRRQSSMDSKMSMYDDSSSMVPQGTSHSRKLSLDRLWSMGINNEGTSASARRLSRSGGVGHGHTQSSSSIPLAQSNSQEQSPRLSGSPADDTLDVKRGGLARFLPKRNAASVPHSRAPSDSVNEHTHSVPVSAVTAPNVIPDTPTFEALKNRPNRAISQPRIVPIQTREGVGSPIVTKLEYGPNSPAVVGSEASSAGHSPAAASHSFNLFHKAKPSGLRSSSDVASADKKPMMSPLQSPVRTGSTTPSIETKSIEEQKSGHRGSTGSSQNVTTPVVGDAPVSKMSRPARSKKSTSAYTRGLEKKAPVDQMVGCDYSGWMKKRSANIMGTWKPRLFVLRGRRLSYYYTESDTEEKGLIDISGHRVLPAGDERITGLHAQITGAKSPVTPDMNSTKVTTTAATDLASYGPVSDADKEEGLFIFKLVPPREGMSRAVNFTKPAVHYFAVGSRQEGRLWMAALMKATIDYDLGGTVSTSYNQETISLAKARARKEKPPALRELNEARTTPRKAVATSMDREVSLPDPPSGLGIDGLINGHGPTTAGAEDSSATSTKQSLEDSEHGALNFDNFGESLRNVISTTS